MLVCMSAKLPTKVKVIAALRTPVTRLPSLPKVSMYSCEYKNYLTLTLSSTVPLNAPTLLPSYHSPYYSGLTLSLECKIVIVKSITEDPGIKTHLSISKDGSPVISNDRIVLAELLKPYPHGKYSMHILNATISSLNQSLDAGNWTCNVNLSSISKYVQHAYNKATLTLTSEEILCKIFKHTTGTTILVII